MKSPTASELPAPPLAGRDLAGALHEVSNALTVVVGWLDNARSLLPPGKARDALEVAVEHARRGHAIARHSIGAPVAAAAGARSALSIARDAATGVAPEATRQRVNLVVDEDGVSDLLVAGWSSALQVLINLLLNAIAFSSAGARVTLRVRNAGSQIEFSVRDQGCGIAADRAQALFDSPGSTRSGGAGIGLRYCHALAGQHGGELVLADTGPAGTKFSLRWPVAEAPSAAVHRSVPPRALDGMRVLLLEDDPAVHTLLDLGLSNRGATVAVATTASELWLQLQQGLFDVLLVDLSPLDHPGAVLASVQQTHPELPIIIISGSAAPDISTVKVSAWVRKPFELSELADVLARFIRSD